MIEPASHQEHRPVTEAQLRAFVLAAREADKGLQKLWVGQGLHLAAGPARRPAWRLKYTLAGKETVYTLGSYPAINLADARKETAALKLRLLQAPTNLAQARRQEQPQAAAEGGPPTFRAVALQWLESKRDGWSPIHYRVTRRALERDVFPTLGGRPIASIRPSDLMRVTDTILARGGGASVKDSRRETASKVLQNCAGVFRLAQALDLVPGDNPATPVKEVLPRKRRATRMPAMLDFPALGSILRQAAAATATTRLSQVTHMAHRLAAFTAARLGNVVTARWTEFDLAARPAVWMIPREKMKSQAIDRPHRIILGDGIAAELRAWQAAWGGQSPHVFPSIARLDSNQPLSREAVEKAYRQVLGLKDAHTPHGWRAAFSTLAREQGFARDVVELALDHLHDTDVVRAYDRGERLQERIRLMQWWDAQLVEAQKKDPAS